MEIYSFKNQLFVVSRPHSPTRLHTLKCHHMDHRWEYLGRFRSTSFIYASLSEQFNIILNCSKIPYDTRETIILLHLYENDSEDRGSGGRH